MASGGELSGERDDGVDEAGEVGDPYGLSIYDYALLNSGPKLAVRAALARLLRSGMVKRTLNGIQSVPGVPPAEDPLEREIISAANVNPRVSILIFWMSRGEAIRAMEAWLIDEEYLRPRWQRPIRRMPQATALGRVILEERRASGRDDLTVNPEAVIALFGMKPLLEQDLDLAVQLGVALVNDKGMSTPPS